MTCLYCGGIHDPKDLDRIGAEYEVTEDGWLVCPDCHEAISQNAAIKLIRRIDERNQSESGPKPLGRLSETLYAGVFGSS